MLHFMCDPLYLINVGDIMEDQRSFLVKIVEDNATGIEFSWLIYMSVALFFNFLNRNSDFFKK